MNIKFSILLAVVAPSLVLSGCNDNPSPDDSALKIIIETHKLVGNPVVDESLPNINDKTAQLGKDLFFSKALSGSKDVACVACHHPMLGGGDDLSLPIGVEALAPDHLGPGRIHKATGEHHDGGPTVPRNAPTTFNMAAWKKTLFHDGRVEALDDGQTRTPDSAFGSADSLAGLNLTHAQARFPVTSPEEMKGFKHNEKNNQQIREFLAQRMGGYGEAGDLLPHPDFWVNRFRDAFNQPDTEPDKLVNEQNISFLLSEYQRTQNFFNTPWKAYIEGDNGAISETAKKGALLFFKPTSQGGANCVSCHSGDFFTDEGFHNIAMPQLGRGKGDGDGSDDLGRFRETKDPQDKYKFRTPTLLNVEVTGPWGHSGAYTSLEAVIEHHLDPATALNAYDYSQLTQPGIQNLDKTFSNTKKALVAPSFAVEPVQLSKQQVGYLVDFMKALTDPCTKSRACLSPWISDSSTDVDPNGDQLNAIGL